MSDFSAEGIQSAAEEVRRSNFGDFMFRDPGVERTSRRNTTRRNTSRRRNTTNRNTTRRNTTRNQNTSRRNTSRKNTSRRNTTRRNTTRRRNPCRNPRNWHTTTRGNQKISTCWDDGNMWELRIKQT